MTDEEIKIIKEIIDINTGRCQKVADALTLLLAERDAAIKNSIQWHKISTRETTDEEKEYYSSIGFNPEYIFDCIMPDDGEEILIATKYGTDKDICCDDVYGLYLENRGDWDDVLAWAKMPIYEESNE